jgi:hypothetical protein
MQMTGRPFFPANRHGIIVDVIAIAANLVLFPLVVARIGSLFERSFAEHSPSFPTLAGLMLFILAARLFGLYLKRFSLQSRLEQSEQASFPMYFFILNIGVFVLNAAFVVVLLSAVAAELGMVETNYAGQPKESFGLTLFVVSLMLVLIAAEIFLIYRLRKPLTEREQTLRAEGNWMFDWRGEFAADFGLFTYVMTWQVFYNYTAELMMTPPHGAPDTLEYRIFSAVFLFIVFLIFYLSPRTVFLIEDRKYLGTWVFIFGVYVSSILRYW